MDSMAVDPAFVTTMTPLHSAVMDLPPFMVVILTLGLRVGGWWSARKGWSYLRAPLAYDRTAAATIASGAGRVVRLNGRAYSGETIPAGFAAPTAVWSRTSR